MSGLTLEEFKRELKGIDWFYEYQDSFDPCGSYYVGKKQFEKVRKIANENEEFKKLFDEADPFRINNQ